MNEIMIFSSEEFGDVRTVNIDGKPWLVGKDVAKALKYKDPSDALKRHVDDEDKLTRCFTDSGQRREMYIINESGFYSLVLGSKLPSAKRFKRWVTSEVLPSIYRTGSYTRDGSANPSLISVLVDELKGLKREMKIISERQKILASYIADSKQNTNSCACQHDRITSQVQSNSDRFPLDEILDELRDSHVEHLGVGQLADIWREHGVDVDEISLFQWLRNESYLIRGGIKYNQPRKKYLQNGWFETKRYYRCGKAYNKPLLTVSGQIAITKAYYTDRA